MITLWKYELIKKYNISNKKIESLLSERILEKILELVNDKRIQESDVKEILENLSQGMKFENAIKTEKIDADDLENEIRKIVKEKPGLRPNAYMGLIMTKFKGKIDAKTAMLIIHSIVGHQDNF